MKKILLILTLDLFAGCAKDLQACGQTFTTTGVLTIKEEVPGVKMNLVAGNVIWGILLSETLIAPVYFFGFSIWEPVSADCSIVNSKDKK